MWTQRERRIVQNALRLVTEYPELSMEQAFCDAELLENIRDRILFEMSVERDLEALPVIGEAA